MASRVKQVLVGIVILAAGLAVGCRDWKSSTPELVAGGDANTGKEKISYYGCPACHEIAGIRTAIGRVGPTLNHISRQSYLAGQLANTPQNMALWIQRPRNIQPHTAMPNMGVSDQDARDITAYLYSEN
ncbi:MAG TPA: c-type cytochrome [Terriglobales bacterium]|nr:c-type cytochrome [Terriglobales bacterium]